MGVYLIKRIFLFIPTLLVISLVAFALSKAAPGDPIERLLQFEAGGANASPSSNGYLESRQQYRELGQELGLDRPSFYFSLTTAAHPDTLYRIVSKDHRETLQKLIYTYGNWSAIQSYYQQVQDLEAQIYRLELKSDAATAFRQHIQALYLSDTEAQIDSRLSQATEQITQDSMLDATFREPLAQLIQRFEQFKRETKLDQLNVPALHWHGIDNQYHRWITQFLSGDFGRSLHNGQKVVDRLRTPIFWTLILNVLAILIAFGVSIPVGVYTARYPERKRTTAVSIGLFLLYSMPTFWLGTMLVVFLTTPEYGLDLFPSIGLGMLPPEAPFWSRFWETAGHLILPVFCLSYGSFAFLSRQVNGSMRDVLKSDYVRTAKAKGLSINRVVWKHAFRNALFPLITLVAVIFPAAIAGSVIVEVIFAIPGMGRTAYQAIFSQDWPIVFTVLMLSAILTLIGQLVADILYQWVDPRVEL